MVNLNLDISCKHNADFLELVIRFDGGQHD